MGHYSLLDIGRIHLEFKYRVPYVCTILFEPKELRVEVNEEEGIPYCEFAGYQTTAQAAIERLQHHGYNEAFYSTVLAPHLEDFEDFYLDTLIGDAPSEVSMKEASEHARFLETLDMSPLIPAGSGDFTAYIEFLRVILDGRRRRGLERKLLPNSGLHRMYYKMRCVGHHLNEHPKPASLSNCIWTTCGVTSSNFRGTFQQL
jgi:hypothetical protein